MIIAIQFYSFKKNFLSIISKINVIFMWMNFRPFVKSFESIIIIIMIIYAVKLFIKQYY
jgi:hypothetical protein